jgi:hypothetical protein
MAVWCSGRHNFFIISGYLITFLALQEERERGFLNFAAFYIHPENLQDFSSLLLNHTDIRIDHTIIPRLENLDL